MTFEKRGFFKFIKKYPYISKFGAIILCIILLVLPVNLKGKLRIVILSSFVGFLVALGFHFYQARKKNG